MRIDTPNPWLAKADPNHPAVQQAPKTLREALERAAAFLNSDRAQPPGTCLYRDGSGKNCIIGSFFTDAQLDDIVTGTESFNRADVPRLAKAVGEWNIELMTGMTRQKAEALQCLFDQRRFRDILRADLASILASDSGIGRIGNVEFNLYQEVPE